MPGLFEPERDFAAVFADYAEVLDGLLRDLQAAGDIPSTWPELGFTEKVVRLHETTGKIYHQHFDFALPPRAGIPAETPNCLAGATELPPANRWSADAVECA